MRRCPACNRTYTDQTLSFCIDDGTPLVSISAPAEETTVVSPSSDQSANRGSLAEETSPPTDGDKVLANLTDLEQEWMVANINADKGKLDRILADDYVGTDSDGKRQGKAEYIRTIVRDTDIQKWDFEDLKVNLKGERATLTGVRSE